jgi:uncharacterized membrane protein YqgA involved in biofilm formation
MQPIHKERAMKTLFDDIASAIVIVTYGIAVVSAAVAVLAGAA